MAGKAGASVILTDLEESDVLDNLRRNCEVNELCNNCEVQGLCWGNFTPEIVKLRHRGAEILLAADCLYDSANFDSFLATAAYLLSGRDDPAPFLITIFQERGSGHSLASCVRRWGLCCEELPCPSRAGFCHLRLPTGAAHTDGGAELHLLKLQLAPAPFMTDLGRRSCGSNGEDVISGLSAS